MCAAVFFLILIALVAVVESNSLNCSNILIGYSPPVTSNNTGSVLGNSAFLFSASEQIPSDEGSQKLVSDRMQRLRETQHVQVPVAHVYIPVQFANPFDETIIHAESYAIFNTGATFNIITTHYVRRLALPLGEPCFIKMIGAQVDKGRFTVIKVSFLGKAVELPFCYIESAQEVLINHEILNFWEVCFCPPTLEIPHFHVKPNIKEGNPVCKP